MKSIPLAEGIGGAVLHQGTRPVNVMYNRLASKADSKKSSRRGKDGRTSEGDGHGRVRGEGDGRDSNDSREGSDGDDPFHVSQWPVWTTSVECSPAVLQSQLATTPPAKEHHCGSVSVADSQQPSRALPTGRPPDRGSTIRHQL